MKKSLVHAYIILGFLLAWSSCTNSADETATQILIKNVNIFDGISEKLAMGQDVLVEANLIKKSVKVYNPVKMQMSSMAVVVP